MLLRLILFIAVTGALVACTGFGGPINANSAFASLGSCTALAQWVEPLRSRFPSTRISGWSETQSRDRMKFLFTDSYFVPIFGLPVDELNARQISTIGNSLRKASGKCKHEKFLTSIYPGSFLSRPFNTKLTRTPFSREFVVVHAAAQRGPVDGASVVATTEERSVIRKVQRRLAVKGFDPGTPDGIYGARTATAITAYKHAERMTPANGDITPEFLASLDAMPVTDEMSTSPNESDARIGPSSQTASTSPSESTSERSMSDDNDIKRHYKTLSEMLDAWLDKGRSGGLYELSERLDLGLGKMMTGYFDTDYRELSLSSDDLKLLPAIGHEFLSQPKTLRDLEKAVATLYFAALVIGGDEESITGSSWTSTRLPKDSEPGAQALRSDESYDWRAQVKLPLGIAAYRAGATLLDDPNYRSNPDTAKWAYTYLWLARKNGVQDAAFLLNSIYSSDYGVPDHHREVDPLEAAWFSFHQVVDVCDMFFDPGQQYNWINRHPMPPRPGSCERARQGLQSARADLNLRKGAERVAKASAWFTAIAAIASILPESSYQPDSGNDRPSIVDITNYGAAAFIFTE